MSVRRIFAGSLSGALVASALLAAASPSAHAVEPDDTTFTPVAADLIGVGSDTSQHAVWSLAQAWNAKTPAPAFRVATYAATGGGMITLPSGAITRPNGSGNGKALLYSGAGGPGNVDVDYARSSSTLNGAEVSAGLQQLPFALDEMTMVVSSSTPSNAPTTITPAQIVAIYKGDITNWSQIDATKSGVIAPKIPQSGSGTYSFFIAQLKAMNGGADVTLAGSVASVQEHDDTAIKSNPNAIAPFSVGRAGLLGDTLRLQSGWAAKRALYNVVRGTDVTDSKVQAVFGPDGFFCSDDARPLIRDAGFGQLDSEADGGVCGLQTTTPTSNFQLNQANADDSDFTPVAADLIGVGSDTSQHAVWSLAQAWNAKTPAPAFRVATYAATGGGMITLPSGAITRPNGSGNGKALLYSGAGGPGNVDVDYARSSSTLNGAEVSAGLQQLPFALDEMTMVVSSSTPSNAPTTITPAQIVAIYKGDITNWSQIDATKSGVIAPKIPQSGSGTYSFFIAQLKAMNGGADVTLAGSVASVQEHDDTAIKSNPNAIAPFSVGRAGLLGDTLRLQSGWAAKRALYNVVRGTDVTDSKVQAVFGPDGFFCSDDAKGLIESAGFGQLDSEADGGVCGLQTTSPTSNFQLNGHENQVVTTSTELGAQSTTPGKVTLTATIASSPAAQGTVTFKEGSTVLESGVALNGGVATKVLTGVTSGSHTYTAVFVPAAGFSASEDDVTVEVAAAATTTSVATSATSPSARRATLKATVTPSAAAGTVTFRDGSTVVATGVPLVNGVATKALTSVKPGTHRYAAQFVPADAAAYAGSTDATPATLVVRTTASIAESFPSSVSRGARARGVVAVALSGTTTKATGKVVVKLGTRTVGTGTLRSGRVTLTLSPLTRGTKRLVITWSGSSLAPKKTKIFTITQR